jgi:hypothetical protein
MIVTSEIIPDGERCDHVDNLFGVHFPLRLEPVIFAFADRLSRDYSGGYWHFHSLSNDGFYMAPDDSTYTVTCDNGFEGVMEADAFGIMVCLYAFSHLSFGEGPFAETCARQFHLIRDYALEHAEFRAILAAID